MIDFGEQFGWDNWKGDETTDNREEAVRLASIHPAATLGEDVGWRIDMHPIGFFEQYTGKAA